MATEYRKYTDVYEQFADVLPNTFVMAIFVIMMAMLLIAAKSV